MADSVTIACCHLEMAEDVSANRERLLAELEAALADADVVVGPETATIGVELDPPEIAANAESLDGETVAATQELVEDLGGLVAFGLPGRADGDVYNTCVVLESGVEPRLYRQRAYEYTHGWTTDHGEYTILDTGVGRVAPLLCADLGFVETRTFLAEIEPDLVVAPANWGEDDRLPSLVDRWRNWSTAVPCPIAIANAYASAARSDHDFAFDGPSAILADGEVLVRTADPGTTITADCSL